MVADAEHAAGLALHAQHVSGGLGGVAHRFLTQHMRAGLHRGDGDGLMVFVRCGDNDDVGRGREGVIEAAPAADIAKGGACFFGAGSARGATLDGEIGAFFAKAGMAKADGTGADDEDFLRGVHRRRRLWRNGVLDSGVMERDEVLSSQCSV